MRTCIGYDAEGRKRWSANQPSTGGQSGIPGVRGSLVVGVPHKYHERPSHPQAVTSIASILSRIEEAR